MLKTCTPVHFIDCIHQYAQKPYEFWGMRRSAPSMMMLSKSRPEKVLYENSHRKYVLYVIYIVVGLTMKGHSSTQAGHFSSLYHFLFSHKTDDIIKG